MKKVTKSELNMPGDCLVCHGTEQREWFLDTGIYLDYVGNFYICNYCCTDFIHAVGGLTIEEKQAMLDGYAEDIHYKDLELEHQYAQNSQIQDILPLTFAEIVERLDGLRPVDSVPSEPEPDSYVADDPLDGSNEPDDSNDDEPKLIKHESPWPSWE